MNKSYGTEKDAFENYANKYNISFTDFKLILKTFFTYLIEDVISNGTVYLFPNKLGDFSIRKKPTWNKGVLDYKLFNTTGIKRWIKNMHSDRLVGVFHWNTAYPAFDQRLPNTVFRFKPSRDNARYLAKRIKETNTINKYYDL